MEAEDHASATSMSYIRKFFEHPEYVLPTVTIWIYLLASQHLDGYLSYFLARPEWFSPSLFQLVSMSGGSILLGAIIISMSIFLQYLIANKSKLFWIVFLIWLCLLLSISISLGMAYWHEYGDWLWSKSVFPCLTGLVWAFMPLWWWYSGHRDIQKMEKLNSAIAELEQSKSKDLADSRISELRQIALDGQKWLNSPFMRAKNQYGIPAWCVGSATLFLYITGSLGFTQASRAYRTSEAVIKVWKSEDGPESHRFREAIGHRVLFSDGTASLVLVAEGERLRPVFRIEGGQTTVNLTTRHPVFEERRINFQRAMDEIESKLQELEQKLK